MTYNITPKTLKEMTTLKEEFIRTGVLKGQPISFKKNDFIFKVGGKANSLFFMTKGLVKCFYNHNDKEVILRLMSDNSAVLSYSGFITGQTSSEYIQCLEHCEGIMLPLDNLDEIRSIHPKLDLIFRYLAEQHYLSMERRLMMLQHKTAEERYEYFCQAMENKIIEQTSMQNIASYLGITPESFSRIRRKLNKC